MQCAKHRSLKDTKETPNLDHITGKKKNRGREESIYFAQKASLLNNSVTG